jgi:hypothetical protein
MSLRSRDLLILVAGVALGAGAYACGVRRGEQGAAAVAGAAVPPPQAGPARALPPIGLTPAPPGFTPPAAPPAPAGYLPSGVGVPASTAGADNVPPEAPRRAPPAVRSGPSTPGEPDWFVGVKPAAPEGQGR